MTSVTIFDIKRFAVHDGPGIRTTVFLKGCPLDCWWCHNPESRKAEPEEVACLRMIDGKEIESKKTYGQSMSIRELMKEILKDKLFFEESGGGVTFSGGEPMNQSDALLEVLQQCKKHGLHTTIDTCGYAQWSNFEKVIPFTELFLYDLKMVDLKKHQHFTGVKNELILTNLQKLLDRNLNVELRIPLVPGVNNSKEELERYSYFLQNKIHKSVMIHLLPYHNIGDNKYEKLGLKNRMKEIRNGQGLEIKEVKKELTSAGFEVKIGG